MVMQRQLCWVGLVIRMSPNRLPRRLVYSELQEGRRSFGGQMKRFFRPCQASAEEMSDTARSA